MDSKTEADFRKVASGLGLVYTSLILIILTVFGFAWMTFSLAKQGDKQSLQMLMFGFLFLILLWTMMSILGRLRCLAVPREVGARSLIFTAVAIDVSGFVLNLASQVPGVETLVPGIEWLNLISSVVSLGAFVTFILFMRRLAAYIGEAAMAKGATITLIIGAVTVGASFVAGVSAGLEVVLPKMGFKDYVAPLILVGLICGLVLLIRFGNLITGLRKAILKYVEAQKAV